MPGKRAALLSLGLAGALLAPAPLRAQNPGVTAASILQIPIGARAIGMGGAFTGVASDLSALYFNPAGLSNLTSREVSFMYQKGLEGQGMEFVGAATPLPYSGLIGNGYATLGGSLLFNDNGTISVNRTNADGSFLDSRTLGAGGDFVGTLGYSERVAELSVDRREGPVSFDQFLGFTGKFIRSTLADAYSASSYAGDLGYLVRSPELGSSLGLSVLNFGGKMKFLNEGDPLPLTFRAGLATQPKLFETLTLPAEQTLTLAADGDYSYYERQWHANLGAEYTILRNYSLRAGYQLNRDVAGLTIGFGAAWRGLSIDYAWAMSDSFSDTHRFSFTYRFGRVSQRAREAPRRPFIESMPEREDLKDIEQQTPRTMDEPRRPRRSAPDGRQGAPGWIY